MTKTNDLTATFKDAMAAFPIDASAAEGAFKTTADLNEKISTVALTAAKDSTEISTKWAQDTLKGLSDVSKAKSQPTDYTQALTDFVSDYSKAATEHMTAFAEIAKKAQADTLELMTAAGKTFSEDATSALKSATAAK